MLRIEKSLLFAAAAALLIMSGCAEKNEYLERQAGSGVLKQDIATVTAKNRQLQLAVENMTKANEMLLAYQKKIEAEYQKLADDKKNIETGLQELREQTGRDIKRLREQNAELAGDKQMLNESIALLKKTKEKEVKKVSGTYETLLQRMEKEIQQGQVSISELKGKLTVDVVERILFDSGKAQLKPEGIEVLRRVVNILGTLTDKTIRVEGHTDNVRVGGKLIKQYPTNWELSAARALTVVRFLEEQGIDPRILAAVAFGQYQPIAANDTPEGRARNRRIAIVLQPNE